MDVGEEESGKLLVWKFGDRVGAAFTEIGYLKLHVFG